MTYSWNVRPDEWENGQLITATDFQLYLTGNLNYLKYRPQGRVTWAASGSTSSTTWVVVPDQPGTPLTIEQPETGKESICLVGFYAEVTGNGADAGLNVGIVRNAETEPIARLTALAECAVSGVITPLMFVTTLEIPTGTTTLKLRYKAESPFNITASGLWILWYAEISTQDV